MLTPDSTPAALAELRRRYRWPASRPEVDPIDWNLDGGGRWMVERMLRRPEMKVVLEVGCFLGGSVRRWLNASAEITVVALDPWPHFTDAVEAAQRYGKSDAVAEQLSRPEGMYQTFLANLWDYRDRVIPVREYSPEFLHELHTLGLQPDLLFLDSDKTGSEVELCHQLFPGTIITGDDWEWSDGSGEYPIREPVMEFCRQHDRYLRVENATWIIDTQPPSLRFRLRTLRRSMQRKWKSARHRAA